MIPDNFKDQIANKYGYSNWKAFVANEIHHKAVTEFWSYIEEAAELYARSKWDEACDEQRKAIDKHTADIVLRRADIFEAPTPEFKP